MLPYSPRTVQPALQPTPAAAPPPQRATPPLPAVHQQDNFYACPTRKSVYTFLTKFKKSVRDSTDTIRRLLRARGSATGAQLAAATGLSHVTIYKELARLVAQGEARHSPQPAPSQGGRRARVYECEPGYARRVLLESQQQGAVLSLTLEQMDLQGRSLRREESAWARLEPAGLESWLATALRRQRIASIALALEPTPALTPLRDKLRQRYHCPVAYLCPAEALADTRENTATLYLSRGAAPRCSLRRHGRASSTGALELLPLPAAWDTLDYTDHTLVEEMIARLLQALSCILAPARITTHADFWSPRLIERIRFNTHSKLKGRAPELHFQHTSPAAAHAALRRRAQTL